MKEKEQRREYWGIGEMSYSCNGWASSAICECDGCQKSEICLLVDTSEGEYRAMSLCASCIQKIVTEQDLPYETLQTRLLARARHRAGRTEAYPQGHTSRFQLRPVDRHQQGCDGAQAVDLGAGEV